MRYDLCLTIAYLVAGASFAESTECTVVEQSIPVIPDPVESPKDELAENIDEEDDEGETEVSNSSSESKAACTVRILLL